MFADVFLYVFDHTLLIERSDPSAIGAFEIVFRQFNVADHMCTANATVLFVVGIAAPYRSRSFIFYQEPSAAMAVKLFDQHCHRNGDGFVVHLEISLSIFLASLEIRYMLISFYEEAHIDVEIIY